jgi:F-type H+-transporting ATPase subunit epsilon
MFKLNLVTPDKKIVTDHEVEEITLPAFAGELTILPGHAPLMTTLGAGVLSYRLKGQAPHEMAISWGYCQVSSEGVSVLAENAITAAEIDTKVVAEHLKQNEARLLNETLEDQEYEKVQHEIARLNAELDIARAVKH